MKRIIFVFILIALISCDNPVDNTNLDNGFLFKVVITGSSSLPLPEIGVSVWNKPPTNIFTLKKESDKKEAKTVTSLQFTVKQTSYVSLNIFDLNNKKYQSLIDNKLLPAGNFIYAYTDSVKFGTGVFKCKMEVKEDSLSSDNIFADSIYLVTINPEPEAVKIGETDELGEFLTDNKLLFPHLYQLPELFITNYDNPTIIGTFNISDTVIIALTDKRTNIVRYFEKEIIDGNNVFNLNFDFGTTLPKQTSLSDIVFKNGITKVDDDSLNIMPSEFKLYQNYPNPYN